MTEELPKYVPCNWCGDRDPHTYLCEHCNNTGEVLNPVSILCNMCGGCMCPLGTANEQSPHGLYNTKIRGGYDSYHLFDMTTYTFSLCEKCLRNLFVQCKIPPTVMELMGGTGEETFATDQVYYEYMIWKDTGGHHQAYLNRQCNAIKDCPNQAIYTQLRNEEFSEDCSCEEHKNERLWNGITLTKFIPPNLKAFL